MIVSKIIRKTLPKNLSTCDLQTRKTIGEFEMDQVEMKKVMLTLTIFFNFLKDMNEGCENGEYNIDNPDFIVNALINTCTCMYDDILNCKISDEEIVAAVKNLKNIKPLDMILL